MGEGKAHNSDKAQSQKTPSYDQFSSPAGTLNRIRLFAPPSIAAAPGLPYHVLLSVVSAARAPHV